MSLWGQIMKAFVDKIRRILVLIIRTLEIHVR